MAKRVITEFGAAAWGAPIPADILMSIMVCEDITGAWRAMTASENWVEWRQKNKELSKMLDEAERLANGS